MSVDSDTSMVVDFLNTTINSAYQAGDLIRFKAAEDMAIRLQSGQSLVVPKAVWDAYPKCADLLKMGNWPVGGAGRHDGSYEWWWSDAKEALAILAAAKKEAGL